MTEEAWIKKIRERLGEHSEPMPTSGWERLEKDLKPDGPPIGLHRQKRIRERKHVLLLYRQWPAVAAVAVLLLLVGTGIRLTTDNMPESVRMATLPELPASTDATDRETTEGSTENRTPLLSHTGSKTPRKSIEPKREYPNFGKGNQPKEKEGGGKEESGSSRQAGQTGTTTGQPDSDPEHDRENPIRTNRPVRNATATSPSTTQPIKRKHRADWSMSLSVGNTGTNNRANGADNAGIQSSPSSPLSLDMLFASSNAPLNGGIQTLPKSDKGRFVDARHRLPLSVGLSVRRSVGKRWSLETGVTYTYMASELTYTNSPAEIKQRLHYIGIPLRANCELVRKTPFSLYVSAGGSIEKCVYATQGNKHVSVKPVQFSVAGAVGTQYDLGKHVGIYVEPGISHYFDDHSDIRTYRKENPTGFTLQGGIRVLY